MFFFTKALVEKAKFFFFKSDRLTWWVSTVLSSHHNSLAFEAFIFIGDVYLALFTMRSLWTLLEENKTVFLLSIFHFSVCLTYHKLYWIEDQLADVSTRFSTSASWRVASWTVGDLTVIHIYLVYIVILFLEQIRGNWNPNCNTC